MENLCKHQLLLPFLPCCTIFAFSRNRKLRFEFCNSDCKLPPLGAFSWCSRRKTVRLPEIHICSLWFRQHKLHNPRLAPWFLRISWKKKGCSIVKQTVRVYTSILILYWEQWPYLNASSPSRNASAESQSLDEKRDQSSNHRRNATYIDDMIHPAWSRTRKGQRDKDIARLTLTRTASSLLADAPCLWMPIEKIHSCVFLSLFQQKLFLFLFDTQTKEKAHFAWKINDIRNKLSTQLSKKKSGTVSQRSSCRFGITANACRLFPTEFSN